MQLLIQPPKKALNKAYLKEKVNRSDIELFKANLSVLLSKINELEREEHHKYPFAEFLKTTWYKNLYEINTKGDFDFVIHDGKTAKDPVGALIEVKRPSKTAEMISKEKPNVKAFHELILYYLRERIDADNKDIKYLIITNIYEWYIIDEKWFEEHVFRNVKLRKDYETWKLSGKDTRFFYESIAKPFVDSVKHDITATWFDIREYQKTITNKENANEHKLIALYKILSPEHLLKKRFSNDNNALDTKFYTELLHIIGLEETEDGGKKVISRKRNKDPASLIEGTIMKLEDKDCLSNIPYASAYGTNLNEQLENIALELCITWINRILFLKLLEAQLAKYHSRNQEYQFLNIHTIIDFNELNDLFFLVLAERPNTRRPHIKDKFEKIPYLNSSLFERTELEKQTLEISDLDNRFHLGILTDTVLTVDRGKRKTGTLQTLRYLFDFLSAYDFSSEGSEEIQEEENKRLISASVLGLIFEKINGFKDGSFFTPSFITMYMCREAIQKKIIQKFNAEYKIKGETLDDLKNYTSGHYKTEEILKFNATIDDLTICDPAVGSGHFLVSALNEILFVKAELSILADEQGVRLSGYEMKLENDELILTYNDNTEIFEYKVLNGRVSKDIQRVQRAIFNEKRRIIENSLFGVDINPNSVKICSLRLWIELLKNAYYTDESHFTELETLPNIDINIKHGNSLVNKFNLDVDLSEAFKNTNTIKIYKDSVSSYKTTNDKIEKAKIKAVIESIKNKFKDRLDKEFLNKISRARGKVIKLEADINSKKEWKEIISPALESKFLKAKASLDRTKAERDAILDNANYKDAFEWRFEFPEVLDSNYKFTGFDIVIGNPPYGVKLSEDAQKLLKKLYDFGTTETAILFIKHGFELLKEDGIQTYIIPKSFSFASNYAGIRGLTLPYLSTLVDCGKVWSDVKLEVCIFELQKSVITSSYRNLVRNGHFINYSTSFGKDLVKKYGFFLNNISHDELLLSEKLLQSTDRHSRKRTTYLGFGQEAPPRHLCSTATTKCMTARTVILIQASATRPFRHNREPAISPLPIPTGSFWGWTAPILTSRRCINPGTVAGSTQLDFITGIVSNPANAGKKTIVLTHHNAVSYNAASLNVRTDGGSLVSDIYSALGNRLPDYWYYGHLHNGIVYNKAELAACGLFAPFGGGAPCLRCMGHGGIPGGRASGLDGSALADYYVQTKVPGGDPAQSNRVLNGFAMITLQPGSITEDVYEVCNDVPPKIAWTNTDNI